MASLFDTKRTGARALVTLAVLASASLAGLVGACSLGNLTPDPCGQSSECVAVFGAGSECVNGYCTDAVKCTTDADCTEGTCRGGYCSVGSCDGTVNGRPCYDCAPATREEFLNACTNATCVPFDPARVTKMPADGKLPPIP